MGRISAPFGVRGWVRVHTFTEHPGGLMEYPRWWLGCRGQWREFEVRACELHPKALVAHLAEINDRDLALALKGCEVAVQRQDLPEVDQGEYYWVDLIGMRVINLQEQDLGTVHSLIETGANDVLVVAGERERLIPFVDQVVHKVDLTGKRILVEWGLDY